MNLQFFSTIGFVSLREAVTEFANWSDTHGFGPTLALLYGTTNCSLNRVGKWDGVFECLDRDDLPVRFETIYEARLFHEKAEMRWLNEEAGFGRSVIVGDAPLPAPNDPDQKNWSSTADIFCVDLPKHYLIWGEFESTSPNGWTRFSTARIGGIWIPITAQQGRARLRAVEYLKEFADGNVAVFQERILGLEVDYAQ